jgi:hypothetical protein
LPVTCGDIGENAGEVEKNLEQIFTNSHRWGCVLLLDEAEVFLAKRNNEDLKRNAMVSVFLRVLEYYSGILFLTTNRVGTIDEAFKSRIHISLYCKSGLSPIARVSDLTLTRPSARLANMQEDLARQPPAFAGQGRSRPRQHYPLRKEALPQRRNQPVERSTDLQRIQDCHCSGPVRAAGQK